MEAYSFQTGIKIGKKELVNQNTYDRRFPADEMQDNQKDPMPK
jgi:hypothetical protein